MSYPKALSAGEAYCRMAGTGGCLTVYLLSDWSNSAVNRGDWSAPCCSANSISAPEAISKACRGISTSGFFCRRPCLRFFFLGLARVGISLGFARGETKGGLFRGVTAGEEKAGT